MASASDIRAGGAYVEIGADHTNLARGLDDARSRLAAWGTRLKAGMAVVGAAFLGKELYQFGASMARAAGESEQSQAQLAAVIKSTGGAAGMMADELNKMGAALSRSTSFDDEAITGAQSLLLTFTKIGSGVFPEATRATLDMSAALGQDLKSSAIQIGKALNDPLRGITALQRVGVSFTEGQKQMIKTLLESGQRIRAQLFILRELSAEFGGSAAANADTYLGRLEQLRNELGNLREAILGPLLPHLKAMAEGWAVAARAAGAWVEQNRSTIKAIGDIAQFLSGTQRPDFIAFGEGVKVVFGGISKLLGELGIDLTEFTKKLDKLYPGGQIALGANRAKQLSVKGDLAIGSIKIGVPTALAAMKRDFKRVLASATFMSDPFGAVDRFKAAGQEFDAVKVRAFSAADEAGRKAVERLKQLKTEERQIGKRSDPLGLGIGTPFFTALQDAAKRMKTQVEAAQLSMPKISVAHGFSAAGFFGGDVTGQHLLNPTSRANVEERQLSALESIRRSTADLAEQGSREQSEAQP